MNRLLCVLHAISLLFAASSVYAGNWPGWRGPTGMGYTDEKDLPLRWDGKTKENLLWKVPLGGIGNSSPIVWGDRIFVTVSKKQTNKEQDAKIIPEHWVACFQAADGKELWRTSVPPGHYPRGYSIYAVPTPVTDGQRVYCWFSSGVMVALDFDGKIVWRNEVRGSDETAPATGSAYLLISPVCFRQFPDTDRCLSSEAGPILA